MVGGVGVIFRKRLGHAQSHTVGKDGQQDKDVKRPEGQGGQGIVAFSG